MTDPWTLATLEDVKVDSSLIGIFGPSGTGKTYFALTHPGKIAYFPYGAENFRETAKPFIAENRVYMFPFSCDAVPVLSGTDGDELTQAIKDNQEAGYESASALLTNIDRALTEPDLDISAIVIDTVDMVFQVGMFASYGTLQVYPEKHWGRIKTWWKSFIERHANARELARKRGFKCPDMIFITLEKPEYANDRATGSKIWGGKPEDVRYMETIIYTGVDTETDMTTGEGRTVYTAKLVKPQHIDLRIANPTWEKFHSTWDYQEKIIMSRLAGGVQS